MSEDSNTRADSTQPSSKPDDYRRACAGYWRLYWAWIQAPPEERETWQRRLTDHLDVCGCRMGMGGHWDPSKDPE